MTKIGSLRSTTLLINESAMTVTTKRLTPNAILFTVGKNTYAVRVRATEQIAAMAASDRGYVGKVNSDE